MKALKILILNGSPKGAVSVTMQYVEYIKKHFPEHEFESVNVSQLIHRVEKDEKFFSEIIESVKRADGVVWAFPLYYMLVPAQYKRFIELVFERGAAKAFSGKYAVSLTTSIHFFDHTAHAYMNGIIDDLEMRFAGSYSPYMFDLMKGSERERLVGFARGFFDAVTGRLSFPRRTAPLAAYKSSYRPGKVTGGIDTGGKRVLILTDETGTRGSLAGMTGRLAGLFGDSAEKFNINDLDIKGGCLGCIRCGWDGDCAWSGKDGYIEFFNEKVKGADILLFCGTIRDRYLSARWKTFIDRSFYNNHQPLFQGKQVGYVISGPIGSLGFLREIFEAHTELMHANLVDIVSDEQGDSRTLDRVLSDFASRLAAASRAGYTRPRTFLGVGGMKVFRDEIFSHLRFPFRSDHEYYKKHGMYDFPQKRFKMRAIASVMLLISRIPFMRREIYRNKIKSGMVAPLKAIVAKH
ncbi:MAG: flavodoxin [Spirochaetes bacterium]|nr:MAG: flavodoxin [Spirochaetota bacterium]